MLRRSSQSITFIVRRGRAGGNNDAEVTAYGCAECVAFGAATGAGDHAAV